MATVRSGLTAEGALYESVARGNKDTFFFTDDPELAANPFEPRTDLVPPMIHEYRHIPPLNGSDFGRSCEFDMEVAGDMFVRPTVIIDLPSWIPPPFATANRVTPAAVGGPPGPNSTYYGYTNGIGYFLFSKIQIYQDKILLMEFSGDALWASRAARGSLNSTYLENQLAGWHDGSATSIGAAATPGRLRLELPFVGGPERGFPSIAMRRQAFKLRLHLRPLEEVVESSDPAATAAPRPWLEGTAAYQQAGGPAFAPLARTAIAPPTIQLETRHIYIDGESALALRKETLELPFSRLYENTFTFGPLDYAPLNRGAVAAVTKRVDAQHTASRLFWFSRAVNDLRAGRRWKVTADVSGGEFYNNVSLVIAGRDRETLSAPLVWRDIMHHAKEDKWPGPGFAEMNWDLGDLAGRRAPVDRQPEGSVNWTTADRPTLYTDLAAVPTDTVLRGPSTEMTAVVDTWAVYTIEGDRGALKYGN